MTEDPSYKDYVEDDFMADYLAYQERYKDEPRESDKVIIGKVREWAATYDEPPTVLDIGCSTGNLLRHLKALVPEARYAGGELAPAALEYCRANPDLEGIDFQMLDVLDLPEDRFNIVIANAVLFILGDGDFSKAVESIGRSLRPGGHTIWFDFSHPYDGDITVRETSRSHPDGLMLHFRSHDTVRTALFKAGFTDLELAPFDIPIDLDPEPYGDNSSGFEDLNSYTLKTLEGRRLIFRGALYTPWCHVFATKGRA